MDDHQFVTDMTGVSYYNSNGDLIKNSIEDHLKQRAVSYSPILEVGDVIKRKNADIFYKIVRVHYEIPNIGYFDYAGNICNKEGLVDDDSRLYFFNQVDIEYKVSLEENKMKR